MIVVTEDRYMPTTPGYITLQDSDGAYYYIHRTLYEQSVVLTDRYGESIGTLVELIGGNKEHDAIRKFVQYVPKPVNIMGYFLALLEEDIDDFVDVVGALDAIASAINLRNLIKQPAAIRQTVQFGQSIRNEYQDSWDHFLQNCYLYSDVKEALSGNFRAPAPAPTPSTSYSAPVPATVVEEEEEPDYGSTDEEIFEKLSDEALAGFDDLINAAMKQSTREEEIEKEEANLPPLEEIPESLGGNGLAVLTKARRRAL